jgi:hypothetical protein
VASPAPRRFAGHDQLTKSYDPQQPMLALAGPSFREDWEFPAQGKSQPEQFVTHRSSQIQLPCGCEPNKAPAYRCRFHSLMTTEGGSVAKALLMDEFHIRVFALHGLAPPDYDAIRQVLDASRFKIALRRAVRTVFRRQLPWDKVRVTVTQ